MEMIKEHLNIDTELLETVWSTKDGEKRFAIWQEFSLILPKGFLLFVAGKSKGDKGVIYAEMDESTYLKAIRDDVATDSDTGQIKTFSISTSIPFGVCSFDLTDPDVVQAMDIGRDNKVAIFEPDIVVRYYETEKATFMATVFVSEQLFALKVEFIDANKNNEAILVEWLSHIKPIKIAEKSILSNPLGIPEKYRFSFSDGITATVNNTLTVSIPDGYQYDDGSRGLLPEVLDLVAFRDGSEKDFSGGFVSKGISLAVQSLPQITGMPDDFESCSLAARAAIIDILKKYNFFWTDESAIRKVMKNDAGTCAIFERNFDPATNRLYFSLAVPLHGTLFAVTIRFNIKGVVDDDVVKRDCFALMLQWFNTIRG